MHEATGPVPSKLRRGRARLAVGDHVVAGRGSATGRMEMAGAVMRVEAEGAWWLSRRICRVGQRLKGNTPAGRPGGRPASAKKIPISVVAVGHEHGPRCSP